MFFIISLSVLLADQLSKALVMGKMFPGQSIPIIKNVLSLTYIHNPGAAFGLMAHRTIIFIGVSLFVIAGIIIFQMRSRQVRGIFPLALGLIAGGAAGNLLDRVRFGEVVDFIDFKIWPVFNLADSAIVIGAGILFIYLWKAESKTRQSHPYD